MRSFYEIEKSADKLSKASPAKFNKNDMSLTLGEKKEKGKKVF